jgi:A/G-specific adenine glycosylase
MLQQTRAATVIPYYFAFLKAFPTPEQLAGASEEVVLKHWEGLGYYSRARNLQKGARYIVEHHRGKLPQTYAELIKVPGIGDYTAGAILSFAFGLPVPAVDGNVVRVVARLTDSTWTQGDVHDRKACRAKVAVFLKQWPQYAALISEGLIELGALVCLPRNPVCPECPLQSACLARRSGRAPELPLPKPKKERPVEVRTILVIQERVGGQVLVAKRPARGLLAGLWELPFLPGRAEPSEIRCALTAAGAVVRQLLPLPAKRHIFSHLIWEMSAWHCVISERMTRPADDLLIPPPLQVEDADSGSWMRPEAVAELAFPSALQPFLKAVL